MAARSLFKSLCAASASCGNLSGSVVLRRSYVPTTENMRAVGLSKGGSSRVMVGKHEQRALDQEAESAWGPDPLTGYYRPSNRAAEIDPAELRELLLKNKVKSL